MEEVTNNMIMEKLEEVEEQVRVLVSEYDKLNREIYESEYYINEIEYR